jgi:hypothetical protein
MIPSGIHIKKHPEVTQPGRTMNEEGKAQSPLG